MIEGRKPDGRENVREGERGWVGASERKGEREGVPGQACACCYRIGEKSGAPPPAASVRAATPPAAVPTTAGVAEYTGE